MRLSKLKAKWYCPIISLFLSLFTFPQTTEAKISSDQPNILFFLVDDLGRHQVGCYGNSFYETPNIDQLAKDGMRFCLLYTSDAADE